MTEKMMKFSLTDLQKDKVWPHLLTAGRVFGIIFSLVGILATLRWIYSWGSVETSVPNDICNAPSSEPVCPWKHVFSDLAQRLHLIEMAFKDQVVAREAIAQEVVNQSDLNGVLDQKLSVFINKVEDLHLRMNKLENRMLDLHSRVISDESVGFLVVIILVIEIIMRFQPRIRLLQYWFKQKGIGTASATKQAIDLRRESPSSSKAGKTPSGTNQKDPQSRGFSSARPYHNGVLNFSPKHGISLRNEVCVVIFKKENENIYITLVESLVKQMDNVRLAVRPYIAVEGPDTLRHLPYCKLFLVFADCMPCKVAATPTTPSPSSSSSSISSYSSSSASSSPTRSSDQLELQIASLKVIKALGANTVVIMANDEGSKRLSGHVLYNAQLRAVQSQEILQELASKGRLFSIWKELTSHQISHMRKILLSSLNMRVSNTK